MDAIREKETFSLSPPFSRSSPFPPPHHRADTSSSSLSFTSSRTRSSSIHHPSHSISIYISLSLSPSLPSLPSGRSSAPTLSPSTTPTSYFIVSSLSSPQPPLSPSPSSALQPTLSPFYKPPMSKTPTTIPTPPVASVPVKSAWSKGPPTISAPSPSPTPSTSSNSRPSSPKPTPSSTQQHGSSQNGGHSRKPSLLAGGRAIGEGVVVGRGAPSGVAVPGAKSGEFHRHSFISGLLWERRAQGEERRRREGEEGARPLARFPPLKNEIFRSQSSVSLAPLPLPFSLDWKAQPGVGEPRR